MIHYIQARLTILGVILFFRCCPKMETLTKHQIGVQLRFYRYITSSLRECYIIAFLSDYFNTNLAINLLSRQISELKMHCFVLKQQFSMHSNSIFLFGCLVSTSGKLLTQWIIASYFVHLDIMGWIHRILNYWRLYILTKRDQWMGVDLLTFYVEWNREMYSALFFSIALQTSHLKTGRRV